MEAVCASGTAAAALVSSSSSALLERPSLPGAHVIVRHAAVCPTPCATTLSSRNALTTTTPSCSRQPKQSRHLWTSFLPAVALSESSTSSSFTTAHSSSLVDSSNHGRQRSTRIRCTIAPSRESVSTKEESAAAAVPVAEKKPECYGIFCMTYDLKEVDKQSPESWKKLVRVAVSGSAGSIANHLLFKIASGEVFGPNQPVALNLLGSERSREALEGVAMELEDSLYPLLREVSIGTNPYEVYQDADWALLIGAKPRGPGMERADLLDLNGQIFVEQGKALNAVAHPNAKVIVVGNPCNTNALIAMKNAPRIPRKNFHALTRLDENRAKCQLALKAEVFYSAVSNLTIWGNHSTTQVPDFVNARISGIPVKDVISDHAWLEEEFTKAIQSRGATLIKKWGRSSAASTAVSIADAMKSLITPTPEGDWFSSAVYTEGNSYGLDEDLVFSLPCRSKGDGDYEVVPGLEIDEWLRKRIKKTEAELMSERGCVSHLIGLENGVCNIREDTMLPGEF